MKSPLAKYQEEMAKIEEHRDFVTGQFEGVGGGYSKDEARFAQLTAQRNYLQSMPQAPEIGDRPGAALYGSAEAFSASFGGKPVDKIQADIKRLNEDIKTLLQSIDKKTGAVFNGT